MMVHHSEGAIALLVVSILLYRRGSLKEDAAPSVVASYTTFITGVVDIGIVTPALIVSGALLLRRAPIGYLLASTMLVFTVTLGPNLTVGGIAQLLTGVISIGQAMGLTAPFVILTLFAIWFTIVLFRNFSEKELQILLWRDATKNGHLLRDLSQLHVIQWLQLRS